MTTNSQKASDAQIEKWLKTNLIEFIIGILIIFILLTISAPALMKIGGPGLAKPIYWAASNLCHQLPYRSWFLFGKQSYYPLYVGEIQEIMDFRTAFKYSGDLEASRSIIGNEIMGFKIAVCQRDLAMYVGLLLSGVIFLASSRRMKKIPIWVWILFGVLPLGLDGITQLAGSSQWMGSLVSFRESTPLLRTITGGLFGIFTGWTIFPIINKASRN